MRLLVIPLTGLGNPYQDSNFRVWKDFVEATKDRAFYYFVTEEAHIKDFPISPDIAMPISVKELPDFFLKMVSIPNGISDMFGKRQGKIPVDAILTSRTGIPHKLRSLIEDWREKEEIPVYLLSLIHI